MYFYLTLLRHPQFFSDLLLALIRNQYRCQYNPNLVIDFLKIDCALDIAIHADSYSLPTMPILQAWQIPNYLLFWIAQRSEYFHAFQLAFAHTYRNSVERPPSIEARTVTWKQVKFNKVIRLGLKTFQSLLMPSANCVIRVCITNPFINLYDLSSVLLKDLNYFNRWLERHCKFRKNYKDRLLQAPPIGVYHFDLWCQSCLKWQKWLSTSFTAHDTGKWKNLNRKLFLARNKNYTTTLTNQPVWTISHKKRQQ